MFNNYYNENIDYDPNVQKTWSSYSKEVKGFHELGKHTLYGRITYNNYPWEIVLDTYTARFPKDKDLVAFTRLRAPFANNDKFTCEIYESSFFSEVAKVFGMQDIIVGDDDFDKKFIVKSSNENNIRKIIDDKYVISTINDLNYVHLKVGTSQQDSFFSHPHGVDELYIEVGEVMDDIDQLRLLSKFAVYLLNRLCKNDSMCGKNI